MTTEVVPPEPAAPEPVTKESSGGWVRPTAAVVCGVLAILCLMLTVVAVWARATIFDSSTVAASVACDAISDPEIQAALAADLADAVTANLQLPDSVLDQLPPALDRLKPVLRSAVNDLAQRAFEVVLGRPRVPDLVAGA